MHMDQLGGCAVVVIRDNGGLIQGGSGGRSDRCLGGEIDKPCYWAGLGEEGQGGCSLSTVSLVYPAPPCSTFSSLLGSLMSLLPLTSLSCVNLHDKWYIVGVSVNKSYLLYL